MKKVYEVLLIVSAVLLLSLFCACSNSYDSLIDDYNKKYFHEVPSGTKEYTINSEAFEQTEMLEEAYEFSNGMSFSLVAPEGGASYKWTALVEDTQEKGKINKIEIGSEKTLLYSIPGVFRADVVNKLVLTVTDAAGTEYKDTALILIE